MAAETRLADLGAELAGRVRNLPSLDDLIEDAGRQRLAAYYLYSALIAGVIGEDELAPERWPAELSEPMNRLGLTRLAPRTERGLDTELTPAQQATRRSSGRELEFAELTAGLINEGAFGSVDGGGRVRVGDPSHGADIELELVEGDTVVHRRVARDQWELVAQQLAGAPEGGDSGAKHDARRGGLRRLRESGISHAVSVSTTLAVHVHPVGVVAGAGTKLFMARIHTGRQTADSLRRVGDVLRGLRAQAYGELRRSQRR
jgi:hypothetical protein